MSIDQVRAKIRCEKCGKKEFMDAELFHPTGEQRQMMRFRRLLQIRWERRVIWKDE